jgi:hypothetical protein
MPVRCRLCDETFAEHVTIHARASVHWRGKSFDAEEAQGSVGLQVMSALGLDVADPKAMDAFLEGTHIEAFREDPMGVEPWQGEKEQDEGEDWEFHLGFREALDGEGRRAAAEAARDAIADHDNFEAAKVAEAEEAVEPVPEDDASGDETGGGDEGNDGGETVDSWSHPDVGDD